MIWAHLFCCKNNLYTLFLSQKLFIHLFCHKKNLRTLFFVAKRFMHFVRKVFACWKLPSGKFRLFGPLESGPKFCNSPTLWSPNVHPFDLNAHNRRWHSNQDFIWSFDTKFKVHILGGKLFISWYHIHVLYLHSRDSAAHMFIKEPHIFVYAKPHSFKNVLFKMPRNSPSVSFFLFALQYM